jgi:hypothetical protein
VNAPAAGWVLLPADGKPEQLISPDEVTNLLDGLSMQNELLWGTALPSDNEDNQQGVTWFLGGTKPDSTAAPYALALVLEEDNPELARSLGEQFLAGLIP